MMLVAGFSGVGKTAVVNEVHKPIVAIQFLRALHQEHLIEFNFESGFWQCDIAQVSQQAVTDDVVEFMAFQLRKLPQSTQDTLQLAACIGSQIDLARQYNFNSQTSPESKRTTSSN